MRKGHQISISLSQPHENTVLRWLVHRSEKELSLETLGVPVFGSFALTADGVRDRTSGGSRGVLGSAGWGRRGGCEWGTGVPNLESLGPGGWGAGEREIGPPCGTGPMSWGRWEFGAPGWEDWVGSNWNAGFPVFGAGSGGWELGRPGSPWVLLGESDSKEVNDNDPGPDRRMTPRTMRTRSGLH